MQKNIFHSRAIPAIFIVAVSVITLCIEGGQIFRILFGIVCVLALVELTSLSYTQKAHVSNRKASVYRGLEYLVVLGGGMYVAFATQTNIALLFACAWGADAAAWIAGNTIGGKLVKGSPFPRTAPTKTVEGTLTQALSPILIFGLAFGVRNLLGHPICGIVDVTLGQWYFALTGPFIFFGDFFASKVKRSFGVKDSSDHAVIKYPFYRPIKDFLSTHGGCLDRIDSVVFTGMVLLFLDWFCILFL